MHRRHLRTTWFTEASRLPKIPELEQRRKSCKDGRDISQRKLKRLCESSQINNIPGKSHHCRISKRTLIPCCGTIWVSNSWILWQKWFSNRCYWSHCTMYKLRKPSLTFVCRHNSSTKEMFMLILIQ